MSEDVRGCQRMSEDVRGCQRMSEDVRGCQKMSLLHKIISTILFHNFKKFEYISTL